LDDGIEPKRRPKSHRPKVNDAKLLALREELEWLLDCGAIESYSISPRTGLGSVVLSEHVVRLLIAGVDPQRDPAYWRAVLTGPDAVRVWFDDTLAELEKRSRE
jgi:hypothetical protein